MNHLLRRLDSRGSPLHRLWLAITLAAIPIGAQTVKEFQFELKSLGGQPLAHTQFAENVLIVDLWGTWCPPCREAVPALVDLYKKYKHHGLEIIGFNYEGDAGPERATEIVRKFAAEHGITYHLALGTPAIQRMVPGFKGYPTILLFKKGLQHAHTHVGFSAEHKKSTESWVRKELGLDEPGAEPKPATDPEGEPEPEAEAEAPEPAAELPPGVIFKPGDGDKGFDFEAKDVDGNAVEFKNLAGKPVVLAFTSTWDQEAASTGKILSELQESHGDRVHVIAASLELSKEPEVKLAKITEFRSKHGFKHRIFPAGMSLQKKIHVFSGMPLFLVFDREGTLVLRENGAKSEQKTTVASKLDELLK